MRLVHVYTTIICLATLACAISTCFYTVKGCYEHSHDLFSQGEKIENHSSSVLFGILAASLILANYILIKILKKTSPTGEALSKKGLLVKLSILFTVTYGIRAVY